MGTDVFVFLHFRVDPDSSLYTDLQTFKEKEGRDHILLNFTFKVCICVHIPSWCGASTINSA